MDKSANEGSFKTFGQAKPNAKWSLAKKSIFSVIVLVVIIVVPMSYQGWHDLYANFFERKSPIITLVSKPIGLGVDPLTINFVVSDDQAGLDEVIVRSEQLGEVKNLFKKDYREAKVVSDKISISLPGKESGYIEGKVSLTIFAFDRSYWSNKQTLTFELAVDYQKPKIEVITTQHNAVVGGAELVFYRVLDKDLSFSGVKVGKALFPGFPAKDLDPDYASVPDVYFTFFPVPLWFKDSDQVTLFARDIVGNTANFGINYRARKLTQRSSTQQLPSEFLLNKIVPIYHQLEKNKYLPAEFSLSSEDRINFIEGQTVNDQQLIQAFKLVNEKFRLGVESNLQQLLAHPKPDRFWSGSFLRPAGSTVVEFAENIAFEFNGENIGEWISNGLELGTKAGTEIKAANQGIVIFVDQTGESTGIYGKMVIIDHGFGLSTVYGHLSEVNCSEGDRVEKNQPIGIAGNTGFSKGDRLDFQVRLYGVPVRPVEWLDHRWIKDHIEDKIFQTKKVLGLKFMVPLN